RRPPFDLLGVHKQQRVFRVAQPAAAVRRVVEQRLGIPGADTLVFGCDSGDLRGDVSLRRNGLRRGLHESTGYLGAVAKRPDSWRQVTARVPVRPAPWSAACAMRSRGTDRS